MIKRIKKRWRGASKGQRIFAVLVAAAVIAIAVYVWRRRMPETAPSGEMIEGKTPMEFVPRTTDSPQKPPDSDTEIDERGIRELLGLSASDPINGEALKAWQREHGEILEADGKWGPMTRTVARLYYWPCEFLVQLTEPELEVLAQPTIHWESGSKGVATQMRDGEFQCRWPSNKACLQRLHYGLTWGINQNVQHAGGLGKVFKRIYELDPDGMQRAVDGHALELIRVTTSPWDGTWTRDANGEGWNPRVMPIVDGVLWEGPWTDRIDRLSQLPAARQAQWERARDGYIIPGIELANKYGFTDRVSYAIAFDSANQLGRSGAEKVMARAFPSGRSGGPRSDIWRFIAAYEHADQAREDKVENRRLAIARKTHPGVCYG